MGCLTSCPAQGSSITVVKCTPRGSCDVDWNLATIQIGNIRLTPEFLSRLAVGNGIIRLGP